MKNSLVMEAVLDPAGIMILIASVISGLLAAWWLFPVGIILWVVMAVIVVRDPSLRINNAIQNRSELTQRFQEDFNRLQKLQVTFFNSIQSSEPGIQNSMLSVNEAITELLNVVYENCRRYSLLENHRVITSANQKLKNDLASVETRLQTSTDPGERLRLEVLQKSLSEKVTQQEMVSEQLNTYSGELAMLHVTLEGFITEVLQAQSASEATVKNIAPQIVKKIMILKKEMENK